MIAFLAKRLSVGFVTLFVASVVVFAVLEVLPGDPAQLMLGMNATDEAVATLREQMGLDQPLLVRYASWIGGLLTGDFGRSFTYSSPVLDLIAERAVVSLPLALIALAMSTVIAIPVGLFAAARRGKAADTITMGAAQIGVAVPNFWFALILIYVFAV
jgi:peptide/nickel transport system permease protein